jgi:photosystem II stability/assembly factor-like uncharacterized protein
MKHIIKISTAIICTACTINLYASSWNDTGGPIGGLGYDIRIDQNNSNTMYVTDNFAGVLKSDNQGEKWMPSNTGITSIYTQTGENVNIFSLTIDPNDSNIIWAGTRSSGDYGIFKSTDGGANWIRKNTGITSSLTGHDTTNLIFRGFTIAPDDSNTIYAQAELSTSTQGKTFEKVHGRVFKSTDGGENWNTLWTGNNLARYLIIDPNNHNTLYLSTGIFDVEAANSNCNSNDASDWGGEGILKSTDAGTTWVSINNGLDDLYVGSLKMHPTDSNILIAGTSSNDACQKFPPDAAMIGGLYITKNGGTSWTRIIDSMISAVAFAPSNPNIIYAAFENGVWRSENGGTSFTQYNKSNGRYGPNDLNAGIPIDITVNPENPYLLFANNYGGGVFKSEDGGQTWSNWSNGYSGARIKQLASSPQDNSLIMASGLSGAFASQHYGINWHGLAFGSLGASSQTSGIAIHPNDSNIILVADGFDGSLHRSTDAGQTFVKVAQYSSDDDVSFNRIMFAPDSNTVYATIARTNHNIMDALVIYKSENSGENFTKISHGVNRSDLMITDLYVIDGDTFYLATSDADPGDDTHNGALYKSTNGGADLWAIKTNSNIGAVTETRSGTVISADLYTGVFRSSDASSISVGNLASWTAANAFGDLEQYSTDLIQNPTSDIVYLSTTYGVFSSSDYDAWTEFPAGLTGLNKYDSNALAINNHALYVGTNGGGVFRFNLKPSADTPVISALTHTNNAALNSWAESNTLTLSGFDDKGTLITSIEGGQYSLNGGAFTSSATIIENGDSVKIRVLSANDFNREKTAMITIENLAQPLSFTVTTAEKDTTPNEFKFDPVLNADLATPVTSNTITITGLNSPAEIAIENGDYEINQDGFTNQVRVINNGDILKVRLTSSDQHAEKRVAKVIISDTEFLFEVSTKQEAKELTNEPPESGGGSLAYLYLLALFLVRYRSIKR